MNGNSGREILFEKFDTVKRYLEIIPIPNHQFPAGIVFIVSLIDIHYKHNH